MQAARQRSTGRSISRSRAQVIDEPVAIEITNDSKIESRLNVLDELLNTERDYLFDLTTLVDAYLQPIRKEKMLSTDSINKIFSNIEAIKELHEEIYKELEEKISDIRLVSSIEYSISEIFSSNANKLKNYVTFSTKYKGAVDEVTVQKSKSSSFSQFLEKTQLDDPQNLRLSDYLIKPIQRLCKYPLIFRELLKSTPEDHKDRKFMQETMKSLEQLTDHVNECNQQAENEAILADIESSLSNLSFHLVLPGRKVLKDENVWVSSDKEKMKHRRLIVFNDLLIIAKIKSKKTYHCVTSIEPGSLLYAATPSTPTPTTDSPKQTSPLRSPGARMLKKRSTAGSLVNLLPAKPELSFQIINLVKKKRYNIQCMNEKSKKEWEVVMEQFATNSEVASLSLEEQYNREKESRIKLQQKNIELYKKIKELESKLEEEISLRRSLQEKLKQKN